MQPKLIHAIFQLNYTIIIQYLPIQSLQKAFLASVFSKCRHLHLFEC